MGRWLNLAAMRETSRRRSDEIESRSSLAEVLGFLSRCAANSRRRVVLDVEQMDARVVLSHLALRLHVRR